MTVSWLQLEQYALGELNADDRVDVERRLTASSEDRACLDAILHDSADLPPLPSVLPLRKKRYDKLWWASAAALAAAIMLAVLPREAVPSRRSITDGVKGGEAAVTLISERTGVAARSFRDGERFKLLVTCPPWLSSRLSVTMFQSGRRYQPLTNAEHIECGNQVPWPGAFSLDGTGAVEVCVSWGENTPVHSPRELEPNVVCERLEHE
jgi:hypothetical protein